MVNVLAIVFELVRDLRGSPRAADVLHRELHDVNLTGRNTGLQRARRSHEALGWIGFAGPICPSLEILLGRAVYRERIRGAAMINRGVVGRRAR